MPIYTRRGDDGDTSLSDGSRIRKDSARVEAYGSVDEACALVGFARVALREIEIVSADPGPEAPADRAAALAALDVDLSFLQQRLMNCASALATPGDTSAPVSDGDVAALEAAIDRCSALTGPWRGFVVPTGCEAAVRLHVARAATRRAERRVVTLARSEQVPPSVAAFVNRASDLLFAAGALANVLAGATEEPWDPQTPPPE